MDRIRDLLICVGTNVTYTWFVSFDGDKKQGGFIAKGFSTIREIIVKAILMFPNMYRTY